MRKLSLILSGLFIIALTIVSCKKEEIHPNNYIKPTPVEMDNSDNSTDQSNPFDFDNPSGSSIGAGSGSNTGTTVNKDIVSDTISEGDLTDPNRDGDDVRQHQKFN